MLKRLLKIMHEIGAVGVMGSFAACLVLVVKGPTMAASGQGDALQLAQTLRAEWGGLWLLLALSLINIVLAVWRPRLYRVSRERISDK